MTESLTDTTADILKAGNKIICPNCSSENESDSNFCYSCGTKLPRETSVQMGTQNNTMGVGVSQEPANKYKPLKKHIEINVPKTEEEEESIFAKELPSWNIEPPQLPVRRVRGK